MTDCSSPGRQLSWQRVAQEALQAGLSDQQAITAVAVSEAESSRRVAVCGDQALAGQPTADGRTWGPSIGLWQIRSIEEAAGSGSPRDPQRLDTAAGNAAAMAAIVASDGWDAWSTYTSGAYEAHLDRAREAVDAAMGDGVQPEPTSTDSGGSDDISASLGELTDPATWGRVLQALTGIVAVIVGVAMAVWDVIPRRELLGAAVDYATRGSL